MQHGEENEEIVLHLLKASLVSQLLDGLVGAARALPVTFMEKSRTETVFIISNADRLTLNPRSQLSDCAKSFLFFAKTVQKTVCVCLIL